MELKTVMLQDYNEDLLVTCWHTCTVLMSSLLLQLEIKAESEVKEENDDDDYAMDSESYLEVRLFYLESF